MNDTQPSPRTQVQHHPHGPQIVEVRTLVGIMATVVAALVSATGGVVVGRNTLAEDPAAIVTTLEYVRSDVAELRADLKAQVSELEAETQRLSVRLSSATEDRWTRSDHQQWESTILRPLSERVDAHVQLEGHPTQMRVIDDLAGQVSELEDRVRALEREGDR